MPAARRDKTGEAIVNTKQNLDAIDYKHFPDEEGRFGIFGGRFVSETLIHALDELEDIY